MSSHAYASAVVLATFSILICLLIIPPMCWHYHNRNIAATVLITWVLLLNVQNAINAILWSTDNIENWYNGFGLCDVEVKFQVASQVALPASFSCVLRALANVMNTERATVGWTKSQRRRAYAIDLVCCVVVPLLQMPLHYIVQPSRYFLFGISGCVESLSTNWVMVCLILLPPLLWSLVCVYYAVLIVIRLRRYRLAFDSILAHSKTNKTRFMRLFLFCLLWIVGSLPLQYFFLSRNVDFDFTPYSWPEIHNATTWNNVEMVPSRGSILFDRYIWLASGVAVFLFFGFGREALGMYSAGLRTLGLQKFFPALKPEYRAPSITNTITSFSSKARLMFQRKSMSSSFATESTTSQGSASIATVSPHKASFLQTIHEDDKQHSPTSRLSEWLKTRTSVVHDEEKGNAQASRFNPLASFKSRKTSAGNERQSVALGQTSTISSRVVGGEPSPTLLRAAHGASTEEVLIRREVRQGSETAETLAVAAKPYEAV